MAGGGLIGSDGHTSFRLSSDYLPIIFRSFPSQATVWLPGESCTAVVLLEIYASDRSRMRGWREGGVRTSAAQDRAVGHHYSVVLGAIDRLILSPIGLSGCISMTSGPGPGSDGTAAAIAAPSSAPMLDSMPLLPASCIWVISLRLI